MTMLCRNSVTGVSSVSPKLQRCDAKRGRDVYSLSLYIISPWPTDVFAIQIAFCRAASHQLCHPKRSRGIFPSSFLQKCIDPSTSLRSAQDDSVSKNSTQPEKPKLEGSIKWLARDSCIDGYASTPLRGASSQPRTLPRPKNCSPALNFCTSVRTGAGLSSPAR